MMNDIDIDKAYVSPEDKFLFEFDATHPKTPSQIKEIEKHARIFSMRDNQDYEKEKSEIWKDF